MPAPVIVSAACDRRAAGEHREAREARLLVVAEQVVAPVDRRAQRLLAGGRVARARAERAERVVQAVGDLAGESSPQRAAASSIASGRPSTRRQISATVAAFPSAELEPGIVGSRALAEQRDGVHAGSARRVAPSRFGQRERRHGVALLGVDGQRLAARRQHGHARDRRRAVRR